MCVRWDSSLRSEFSAVAANRNSETLTRVQRVPSQSTALAFQWSRVVGINHTLVAGVDARDVRGASDELAFLRNRPTFFIGAEDASELLAYSAKTSSV